MEEIPILPNNPEVKNELPPDPKIIGDLLLGYKIPGSERTASRAPIAIEREPKLLVSRDKLRDKISRYKEQKAALSSREPRTLPPPELTETHLERRHEVFDEQGPTDDDTAPQAGAVPILATQQPVAQTFSQPYMPPTTPPPLMPAAPKTDQPANTKTLPAYKKPLIFGLIAGTVIAGVFIYIYFG